ncbi:MAG: multidrug transporter ATP-binding protein [Gammaproteobacteria bacterium]|nr:multidrug transporter ATP-binding protein [Gammaproteobacteria bacterium]
MIVYHVCQVQEVSHFLETGLVRREGRHYVFEHWQHVQLYLSALMPEAAAPADIQAHVVLVLNVDQDVLLPAPITARRRALRLDESQRRLLDAHSRYLEIDLNPERIVDVKDTFGNSVFDRYRGHGRRRTPIWRFLAHVKPYWPYVALATCAGLLKFLMPLIFPWMLRHLLDDVVLKEGLKATVRNAMVMDYVLIMIISIVIWMIACYFRSVFSAYAGHRMIRDLRVSLFDHVQRLSHAFFTRNQSGAIVTRVINDMSLAQNFVGSALTNVWMDSITLLVLVAILLSIHPMLTLVSLALMPVYVLSLKMIGPRIRLVTKEAQQRLEVLSGGLQEKVAGVAIVKGFTREPLEAQFFAIQANKLLNKILYSVRFMAMNETMVGLVVHGSPVLVVWYGVYQIIGGHLTVGALTQFLLYLAMFYFPLQRLSDLSVVLANALAAIERIFEYFDTQPQIRERPGAKLLAECKGAIEFEHVYFSYDPDVMVLRDICLRIEPGETVAFVGPSGSGKSTLANLVPRFYDPGSGVIRIDGNDLRDLQISSLRRYIGIVNQETILFSGTVLENLLLANTDASQEEVRAALEAANALEFVENLPEGMWTEIGERGAQLSGGQKQRIALARAFLRNPRILILDEATSALDSRSEHHIQQALTRLLKERTSIVIAHRLSTILSADKIAVIEHGRIIDIGRHADLLERRGLYAALYEEQFRPVDVTPELARLH